MIEIEVELDALHVTIAKQEMELWKQIDDNFVWKNQLIHLLKKIKPPNNDVLNTNKIEHIGFYSGQKSLRHIQQTIMDHEIYLWHLLDSKIRLKTEISQMQYQNKQSNVIISQTLNMKSDCDDKFVVRENSHLCCHCRNRYETAVALEEHQLNCGTNISTQPLPSVSEPKIDNKCFFCDRKFGKIDDLVLHGENCTVKLQHIQGEPLPAKIENTRHECDECDRSFATKKSYVRHKSEIHPKGECCICDICNKKFRTRVHIKRHMQKWHMPLPCLCNICGKSWEGEYALKKHIETHFREMKHACDLCDSKFATNTYLKMHIRRCHDGEKRHSCEQCNKRFFSKTMLKYHMRLHTGDYRYPCPMCDRAFVERGILNNHIKSKHHVEKRYSCLHCGKLFRTVTEVRKHEATHNRTGDEPIEKKCACDLCPKKFAREQSLKCHRLTHINPKAFRCELCQRNFASKGILTKHTAAMHTNQRSFPCTVCDKRFNSLGSMKRHSFTHTDEKPFVCKHCGKGFAQKYDLAPHERIHTGEKPFGCEICSYRTVDKRNLSKHMKTHTQQ